MKARTQFDTLSRYLKQLQKSQTVEFGLMNSKYNQRWILWKTFNIVSTIWKFWIPFLWLNNFSFSREKGHFLEKMKPRSDTSNISPIRLFSILGNQKLGDFSVWIPSNVQFKTPTFWNKLIEINASLGGWM